MRTYGLITTDEPEKINLSPFSWQKLLFIIFNPRIVYCEISMFVKVKESK